MNLFILSNSRSLYSTIRLFEESSKRGHNTRVYPPIMLSMHIEKGKSGFYFQGKPVAPPDCVIPRVGQKKSDYTLSIVRHFEMSGVFSLNGSQSINKARDKWQTLQILAQKGIAVPRSFSVDSSAALDLALEKLGGAPVIIKSINGTQGLGVMIAESRRSALAMVESLISMGQSILLQEFIEESEGTDYRIIVLNGKTVAAMKRKSTLGDFRSNVHRGGSSEKTEISIEASRIAQVAARILGLKMAGVDVVLSKRGPLVLEVNPSPGLEGIEKTTGANVARECILFLEQEMKKDKLRANEKN